MNRPLLIAASIILLGIGLLFRKVLPLPHVWTFALLSWSLALLCLTAAVRSSFAKSACVTGFAVLLALSTVEGYLSIGADGKEPRHRPSIAEIRKDKNDPDLQPHLSHLDKHDPDLGARPKAMRTRTGSKVMYEDEVVFNVVYSTLDSGWRVTPQHPEADTAVVFFGCSFTIGEGLEDQESFPYKVGEMLGDRYQTFNFGFHGYGSHQMLAQIQSGYLDDIARRYKTIHAYFLTIPMHELRSAGYSHWDQTGPWFVSENGKVIRKGKFSDNSELTSPPGYKLFRNSQIYRAVISPKNHDLAKLSELHADIIAQADRELREKYHSSLTVLLWPKAPYAGQLFARGVPYEDLYLLYPGYDDDTARYVIPHDSHPNAYAADLLARKLANDIRQKNRVGD